jgi:probable HAF family extracellular repeat protein
MEKRLRLWGLVVLGLSVIASGISNYDITLPSYPPGEILRQTSSLNDNNQLVGPNNGQGDGGYLWQNGTKTSFAFPQGMWGAIVNDINNAGHAVGGNPDTAGRLWNGSQYINLGSLGNGYSMPYALNESDQVVGGTAVPLSGDSGIEPFLWQNNVMISLGTFGGRYGIAYDINNPGVVVGFSNNASGQTRAFIYRNSTMTDLGTLGGSQTAAVAINDANEVVGWSETASGYQHAYVWRNGVMTDLGTLGGNQSQAFDINNSGQILGWAETATGYRPLVVWENGTAVRLNSLIAADSGWELVKAESPKIDEKQSFCINNNGAIMGEGFINGSTQSFLMLPRAETFFLHDSNEDGSVDMLDFAVMSDEWLK